MLTLERLHAALSYDAVTGIFRWVSGDFAGSIHSKGYRRIVLDGVEYLEHRLVWYYVHGEWPDSQIDHVNGDKADNRLINLRLATRSENGRNRPKMRNNKAGFKGVSWHKGNRKWRAQITLHHTDTFLGYFATREQAAEAYDQAALRYHGEFAKPNTPLLKENEMKPEDFIHIPIPAGMFTAVCALLGGGANFNDAFAVANEIKRQGSKPQPADPAPGLSPAQQEIVGSAMAEAGNAHVADDTVDAAGWPWDAAMHASTRTMTKEGLWRMKVGVARPDAKPGFPKSDGTTGTKDASQEAPAGATAAIPAAGVDEDEFAAFRAAADQAGATDAAAAASIPARKWTDADLGALCNQAAVKLGDPAPVKAIIAEFAPAGEVPHSRLIPDDKRDAFAKAVEAKAGITFAG